MAPKLRVHAYRNLNVRDFVAYSIRDAKTGKVITRVPDVMLGNAEFRVQEGGRQRVLREQRKNVHAFVIGDWYPDGATFDGKLERVRYNPYLFSSFVRAANLEPVDRASVVVLNEHGAWAVLSGGTAIGRNPVPRRLAEQANEVDLWNG